MKIPWPFRRSEKALRSAVHTSGGGGRFLRVPFLDDSPAGDGDFDYKKAVGDGTGASALMAPIQFVQRSMPESPAVVERRARGGDFELRADHPLALVLDQPNPAYTGADLWAATVFSYLTAGNAYWQVVRNRRGRPVELWWMPHWLVEPQWPQDGSAFISGYEYRPRGGNPVPLELEDVVHFRHGIDPSNQRLGISPIASILRELWVDMESAEFVAALLRNNGVPGMVVSPDSPESVHPEDVSELKRYIERNFTGSQRGKPLVMSSKTKVDRVGLNPQEMNLTAATDRTEERVCALLGIPSAVVGFSAGLEQTRVGASMTELRRLAWSNGIIPLQRRFADEIERSLLPAFEQPNIHRVRFDRSEVEALHEERSAIHERVDRAVANGWMTVAEAKRQVGLTPLPDDEVYLRKAATIAVPATSGGGQGRGNTGQRAAPVLSIASKQGGDHHTGAENRILESTERVDERPEQTAFMREQEAKLEPLREAFKGDLTGFFSDTMGQRAADNAEAPVAELFAKQTADDQAIVDRVMEAMKMSEITGIFQRVHEQNYLRVAEETAASMETLGLGTDLPDPVQRAIIATGGRRAGLVDLERQTRTAMFNAIETARAEGEGVDAVVRRIRDDISRGPWSSAEIRARTIARTETKNAQRVSALENAKAQDVQFFRVFDARLGPTDEYCQSIDGRLVTREQADQLAVDEHPNGTRDFVPHFGEPPDTSIRTG